MLAKVADAGQFFLFAELRDCDTITIQSRTVCIHTAVQSQKAVPAYFSSEQLLSFEFTDQHTPLANPCPE